VALTIDGEPVPFRKRLNRAINCFEKIIAMRLNVKTDEVGSEKTVDKLALPGANPEDFSIGPGNVPEDGDTRIGPRFLDHSREQSKVIVLCEKDRRFGAFHFCEDGIGEAAIDLPVVNPVLGTKYGAYGAR
jgi:hypothetical protein